LNSADSGQLWRPRGIRLFRPLAEQGNPKAQSVLGVMYRKGKGVSRNPSRAFMWFSLAAKRGDGKAKAGLRDVSQAMTPAEISTAREWRKSAKRRTIAVASIDRSAANLALRYV
jgi:TPR repeat protein